MSFGSGMSRQQTPIKAPPMQRTDQWGSILEAINNPSVLITGNTANSKIIEYYNQLKKENNAEYDKFTMALLKKRIKKWKLWDLNFMLIF
jgi:gamma-glutamyl-gamma-aminobutyrate hydrolase PuuD